MARLSGYIYKSRGEFDNQASRLGYNTLYHIEESYSQAAIVSNDDHIVVVCKGTDMLSKFPEPFFDILSNINCIPRPWSGLGYVHSGYCSNLNRIRYKLRKAIFDVAQNKDVYLTGHSLGGVSVLLYASFVLSNPNPHKITSIITFGSPRCATQKAFEPLSLIPIRRYAMRFDPASSFGFPYTHPPCETIQLRPATPFTGPLQRHLIDTYINALEKNENKSEL